MEASVIVPARNAEETVDAQLEALSGQDFDRDWELLLVDDRSTDGTLGIGEEWRNRLPNLRVLSGEGRGSGAARNAGVAVATSERLLFCDADDVVAPDWVRYLASALDRDDLVGGALEYRRLNAPRVFASRNPIQEHELTSVLGHLPYASSANLGIRRKAFDAVNGFDEGIEAGSDADLCWRAQYAGFSIGFASSPVVHYRFRSSRSGMMRQSYSYALGNQGLYIKHHRLGMIKTSPASRYRVAVFELLRPVWRVPDLWSRERRWRYLSQVARCRGTIAGLFRYRIRPW